MNRRIVKWIKHLMQRYSIEELSIALGEPSRKSTPGILTRQASNPYKNMRRRLKRCYTQKKRFPVGGSRLERSNEKEKS